MNNSVLEALLGMRGDLFLLPGMFFALFLTAVVSDYITERQVE